MKTQEICYEYEQLITGNRATYASGIFKNKKPSEQESIALDFFRTVIEKYLHWTPEEAFYQLNKDTIIAMKLKPLLRYINFSYEFNIDTDCHLLVAKIYPKECKIDTVEETKRIYIKVLNKELSRYPKHFFEELEGERRALICLQYALVNFKNFENPEELYQYIHEHGIEFFKKNKLMDAFKINYDFPIEYLHHMFPEKYRLKYQPLFDKYIRLEDEEYEANN